MLVFGRVKPLGIGAESTVFPAAIKIKNDPGDAKREYTMHRMCASAYVVPVEYLEIARAIVMPAATMDLFAFLETNATIEPDELWRIVRHMSAAVAAVHRACVVHRDVKLENFMCFEEPCGDWAGEADESDDEEADEDEADRRNQGESDDEEEEEEPKAPKAPKAPNAPEEAPNAVRQISSTRMVVKLTDFGFATKLEEGTKLTATQGTRVGTIPYVAPEIVAFAPYDAKADVRSLGVCVFMLLTKCAPFDPPNYGTFAKGAQKRWSGRSKVLTEPQRAVVARSLVVDQDKRASSRAISRATVRCI
jgi:serine/threonine protein kinase